MTELPVSVRDYLSELAFTESRPAYLLVDSEGNLARCGGDLTAYGLQGLTCGVPVGEQVHFLEGLFPLGDKGMTLPFLHTEAGRMADLHLLRTPEGDCALLIDATEKGRRQQQIQQRGYDASLSYQRLLKEIQKKDVLLHCIVHDLAGPLMGIRGGFELLSKEAISDSGRKFLDIGLRQAAKQEALIREILVAFSAEVKSFEAFHTDAAHAPDAAQAAREMIEGASAAYAINQIRLQLDPEMDLARDWKVVGEKSRLDRVLANLIENALRHSPSQSTVTVGCYDEGENILVAVDDQGPGIPPEIAPQLFQKFAQGKKGRGKIGLGLYFCRMTIEHWGGEIGHSPREGGGTRFWFRLPRPKK
jgi:hypothetical protein